MTKFYDSFQAKCEKYAANSVHIYSFRLWSFHWIFFMFIFMANEKRMNRRVSWKNQAPIKVLLIRSRERAKNWIVKTFDILVHDWKFMMKLGHGCLHHWTFGELSTEFRIHNYLWHFGNSFKMSGQRFSIATDFIVWRCN